MQCRRFGNAVRTDFGWALEARAPPSWICVVGGALEWRDPEVSDSLAVSWRAMNRSPGST